MMGRELLHLVGIGIDWITTPAANCFRTGNHLGNPTARVQGQCRLCGGRPRGAHGRTCRGAVNKKGAEVLFVVPSADYFGDPHYFGFLGYLALFHEVGLDYTLSTYRVGGRELRSVPFGRDDEAA